MYTARWIQLLIYVLGVFVHLFAFISPSRGYPAIAAPPFLNIILHCLPLGGSRHRDWRHVKSVGDDSISIESSMGAYASSIYFILILQPGEFYPLAVSIGLMGFFLLPLLPVIFECAVECTSPTRAECATFSTI